MAAEKITGVDADSGVEVKVVADSGAEKKERAERRSTGQKAQAALEVADRRVEKIEQRLIYVRSKIGALEVEMINALRDRAYLASHPALSQVVGVEVDAQLAPDEDEDGNA